MKIITKLIFLPLLIWSTATLFDFESVINKSYLSLPSAAAAPPGMILVMKILGSSSICGLSEPPAILNPSPVVPCRLELCINQRPH